MAYSEDHIALAAEYALGTLDADERAQVETMMAADTEFTAIVQAWEYRLGALNQMVGSVEPRPIVWENIKAAIASAAMAQAPLTLREAAEPQRPTPQPLPPEAEAPAAPVAAEMASVAADRSNVIQLAGRVRRWRNIASVATAIAAALIAMLAVQVYRPDLLPDGLRPKPPSQTAQYVALLQRDSSSPAFILTVDAATKNFTVRKVGAAAEPGKSFELWLISDRLPQPRSLGVIGGSDFTARGVPADYDAGTINSALFAVTVEQAGGSPDGKPTSAPIYTGKLIETVPAGSPR